MKKLQEMGKKIINQWIDDSEYGWPPDCAGFLYQPERPDAPQRIDAAAERSTEQEC